MAKDGTPSTTGVQSTRRPKGKPRGTLPADEHIRGVSETLLRIVGMAASVSFA